jgi:hypothetical protein
MKQLDLLKHIDKMNPPKKLIHDNYVIKNIKQKKLLYLQT